MDRNYYESSQCSLKAVSLLSLPPESGLIRALYYTYDQKVGFMQLLGLSTATKQQSLAPT